MTAIEQVKWLTDNGQATRHVDDVLAEMEAFTASDTDKFECLPGLVEGLTAMLQDFKDGRIIHQDTVELASFDPIKKEENEHGEDRFMCVACEWVADQERRFWVEGKTNAHNPGCPVLTARERVNKLPTKKAA